MIPEDAKGLSKVVRSIVSERTSDIQDFQNLKNVFISGRKVLKVPTESADVETTDRAGDFNYDEDYIYLFTGSAWGRVGLETW